MRTCCQCTLILLLALSGGCAALQPAICPAKPAESKASYTERKQTAISNFEKHRDQAQIQVAVSCWERGQPQQAEAMLQAIVQRSPKNLDARLRLAELLAAEEEAAAAEEQLQECLRISPEAAEVHHALGLLLSDQSGRDYEARQHLRRAAELAPQNAAFAAVAS